jgi:hypothetical protein
MKHAQKHFETIRLELNKDASAIVVLTTLGLFIGTAAILLKLFCQLGMAP